MGHLLKQSYYKEKIEISELSVAELIFVYTSQFNNLPWRVPVCLEGEFQTSFDIKERAEETAEGETGTKQRLSRTAYLPDYRGGCMLDNRTYEVETDFAQDALLHLIYRLYKNKSLSKHLIQRLFRTLPSTDWQTPKLAAVAPYDGIKMNFWLKLREDCDIELKKLFLYKEDLVKDFKNTISFLKEEVKPQEENGIESLIQKLIDGSSPNSLNKEFFPIAEALVRFTIEQERVPLQSGKDKKELWQRIKLAASRFQVEGEEERMRISFKVSGSSKKETIESSDVAKHVNATYYPKLIAQVAMLLIPEGIDLT